MPSTTAPSSRIAGPNDREFLSGGGGLVVDLDGPVRVERQPLPGALVPVDDAVADHDAVVAEPVVIAVDGEHRAVVRGDHRGVLGDVGAEAVLRERRPERRRVGEHDVGDVVGHRAVAASGGDRRQGDGGVVGDGGRAGDRRRRGIGGRVGAGLRRLVGRDVGDLDVVDDEAVQRPGRAAAGGDGQGGSAGDECAAEAASGRSGVLWHADVSRKTRCAGPGPRL